MLKRLAVLILAVCLWASTAQAQIFQDSFTGSASGTIIYNHTPDTIGTSWTEVYESADETCDGSNPCGRLIIDADVTGVRANAIDSDGSSLYTADATYSTANYSVAATFSAFSASGAGRTQSIACRIQDANNFVIALLIDSTDTHDARLFKVVGGVDTELSSTEDTNWTSGDIATLVCNGDQFSLQKNGVDVITAKTASDAGIQAAGKAGIGSGDFTGNLGFASASGTKVTLFVVTAIAGAVGDGTMTFVIE